MPRPQEQGRRTCGTERVISPAPLRPGRCGVSPLEGVAGDSSLSPAQGKAFPAQTPELPRRNPNYHFINLARNATAVGVSCPANVADGDCALEGIRRDLAILSDRSRSREDRVFALMALGHWLGEPWPRSAPRAARNRHIQRCFGRGSRSLPPGSTSTDPKPILSGHGLESVWSPDRSNGPSRILPLPIWCGRGGALNYLPRCTAKCQICRP